MLICSVRDQGQASPATPASLEVPVTLLEPFIRQQASGEAYYGEGLLPPSMRARPSLHSPALAYAQALIGMSCFCT